MPVSATRARRWCAAPLAVVAVLAVLAAGRTAAPAGAAVRQQAAVAPAPVLLADWPLGEQSGSVAHDTAGGHDGTISGAVALGQVAQGPTVTSFGFAGAGIVQASAPGPAAGARTVTAWFRLPRHPATPGATLVDTGGIRLTVDGRRLAAAVCPLGRRCVGGTLPATVDDGAWHQAVVSVAATRTSAYVDGRLAGRAPVAVEQLSTTGTITIGRGFRGDIDDVALWNAPLPAATVDAQFSAGACPQAVGTAPVDRSTRAARPAVPLRSRGRFIVDRAGQRVKLAGVNWYGAEELDRVPAGLQCQPVDAIAARIAAGGFDVVRLPWATSTWLGADKAVPPVAVAANPQLRGRGARAVFDAVVDALARHGLLVMLDNHVSRAGWCCSGIDGNALWWEGYDPAHPPGWQRWNRAHRMRYFAHGQSRWLRAWRRVAHRYAAGGADPQPAVVAADLRNEPRADHLLGIGPRWTATRMPPWEDWAAAASRAGNRVLRANPRLLVTVEGLAYATDLRGAAAAPIRLRKPHRLIYSAHDYAWMQPSNTARGLHRELGRSWGWLLTRHRRWTTPVVVGEFGACHPEDAACDAPTTRWFRSFTRYLTDGDIDWIYWSVNGTGARGRDEPTTCAVTLRFAGCGDGYGVSTPAWDAPASPRLSATLRGLAAPTQFP